MYNLKLKIINNFVILGRDTKNTQFYIISKKIFENNVLLCENNKDKFCDTVNAIVKDSVNQLILIDELNVIKMINDGDYFFTYNKNDNSYTNVIVVDKNIKTIPNDTEDDNISKLPILIE